MLEVLVIMGTLSAFQSRATIAALWSTIEIFVRYVGLFVISVILARALTPADFGLMALLLVFSNLGALMTEAGFGVAIIQRQHTTPDDETTAFWFTLFAGLVTACLLWASAGLLANFFSQSELVPLARAMALIFPIAALGVVPDALLTKRLNFKARAIAQTMASLISGTLAIGLAWHGFGVWSLAWQVLAETGIRSILLWLISGWYPHGRVRRASLGNLVNFGGYVLLAGVLSTVSTRLQLLLLGKLFDTRTLGYYVLAQNTQQAPTAFVETLLARVGLPLFSQIAHDPARLRDALRMTLHLSMFVFLPNMIGVALVSRPLVELLYGSQWGAAAPILTLLALAAALWPIHVLNLTTLNALGRSDLFFALELAKNVIALLLTLLACPFGPMAVAGAALGISAFAAVINSWFTYRLLGYGLLAQLADQKLTLLATLAAALPAWGVMHWSRGPAVISAVVAVVVAIAAYVAAAIALRHPALLEFRTLAARVVASRGNGKA